MKLRTSLTLPFLLTFLAACGIAGEDIGSDQANDTVVINPADQTGTLEITAPAPRLAACANVTAKFGPNEALSFDNGAASVWTGGANVGVAPVNKKSAYVKGSYQVAINDTFTTISMSPQATTTVGLGWLEVENVNGDFTVTTTHDFSNGTQLFDASFKTGCGFYVVPGRYTVNVTYQAHTIPFEIDVLAGKVATVKPQDLQGDIVVLAPTAIAQPDWAPASRPKFGPNEELAYDNGHFAVYANGVKMGVAVLGAHLTVPKGRYTVALNDTKFDVDVAPAQTTTVHAGRLEVGAPASGTGTYSIVAAAGDFSGGTQVLDTEVAMGTGFNLLPGGYTLTLKYQGQTITQNVTVRDQ